MKAWLYLVGAIILEVTGSLSLKAAIDTPALYVLVAIGYLGSFGMLFQSLRSGMALGVGYGVWGAGGVALTAIFSMLNFGEPNTLLMGIGNGVIKAGELLVELGSQAAQKKHKEQAA